MNAFIHPPGKASGVDALAQPDSLTFQQPESSALGMKHCIIACFTTSHIHVSMHVKKKDTLAGVLLSGGLRDISHAAE